MKRIIRMRGLDCPVCGKKLEDLILKVDGVTFADVNFLHQKIEIECETEASLENAKRVICGFEEVQIVTGKTDVKQTLTVTEDGRVVIPVENLDCPTCAMELEEILKKIKGVKDASADVVTQTVVLEIGDDGAVKKAIEKINKFENVKVLDGGRYATKWIIPWKEIVRIVVSAAFFSLGFLFGIFHGLVFTILQYCAFAVAYISVGYPVLISTCKNVARGKIFDENFLMTVASIGAICIGEIHEGVAVMLLYQTGEFLQGLAVGNSRRSIAELMALKSESATLVTPDGAYLTVDPETLCVGDTVAVKVGEKVPVDVTLLSENASIDTKSLTGETALTYAVSGDEILSGSINAGGVFTAKVLRRYSESATAKILDLVENSTSKKAAPEKFISKFAKIYTPAVCLLALAVAVFAPLIGHFAFGNADVSRWVQTALTFLVISCPCALVISVPLTYFSGIGACAKNGILAKGATHLDTLAKTTVFAFDKTGTLTKGAFEILRVIPETGIDEREILTVAAALERGSSHPIGGAFDKIDTNLRVENVKEEAGKGVRGEWNGELVAVGNSAFIASLGVAVTETPSAQTLVYVAKGAKCLGAVEIGDRVRSEAAETVRALKAQGVKKIVMITGDREEAAKNIAKQVGVDEVFAGCLPDEKLRIAQRLQSENTLAYVGDGVNDAPVMTVADCAVSMGTLGSAAAVEASDFVLISDRLNGLEKALRIAKKTRKIVKQNVWFSIVMKAAFMALGAVGILPLWLAVFADVGVMLIAVLNSMRMRRKIKD
ncbi:MAG: cadmium-translocating P-type ATPase [Clostridia bacterium]|nr:cadmium-translocating P-type ATPase [Clostridia bacterium]